MPHNIFTKANPSYTKTHTLWGWMMISLPQSENVMCPVKTKAAPPDGNEKSTYDSEKPEDSLWLLLVIKIFLSTTQEAKLS